MIGVRALHWFDRRCKGLCVRLGPHPKHRLTDEWYRWYLRHVSPDARVLDYGCGSGVHTRALRLHGCTVDAYDPALWTPMNIVSGYDAILCLDVLQLVFDRYGLLHYFHSILVPDGQLLLAIPYSQTRWRVRLRAAGLDGHYEDGARVNYTVRMMYDELEAAGFRVQSIEPTTYDTPLAGLIDLIGHVSWPLYHCLAAWKRRRVMNHWQQSTGFRLVCVKR